MVNADARLQATQPNALANLLQIDCARLHADGVGFRRVLSQRCIVAHDRLGYCDMDYSCRQLCIDTDLL